MEIERELGLSGGGQIERGLGLGEEEGNKFKIKNGKKMVFI